MKIFSNWESPVNTNRNSIVFNNRNHDYGAYIIRKEYSSSVLKSFAASIMLFISVFAGPYIYSLFKEKELQPVTSEGEYRLIDLPEEKYIAEPEQKIKRENIPAKGGMNQGMNVTVRDSATNDSIPSQDLLALSKNGKDTSELVSAGGGGNGFHDTSSSVDTFIRVPDVMPEYPGGQSAMREFLGNRIKYPAQARENNIEGTVYINFLVDKNGEVRVQNIVRGIGGGCDEEAMRVLALMPRWMPGKVNDHPVNVQFVLPVSFRLR